MPKASDNAFPSILITEGTEPSAPAAGKQRLYIDSTSHKLKRTDSSGTDVTIEGAASGAVTSSGLTMATARLLGRTTASTGAIEEITVGSGLSLSAGSLTATGSVAPTFVGAKATNTAGTSISNNTETAVVFATEDYDSDAFHDLVTNNSRLTVPSGKAGKYHITGKVGFSATTGTGQYAYIRVNGAGNTYGITNPGVNGRWSIAAISVDLSLAVADYVELIVLQDAGAARTLDTAAGRNYLSMFLAGA